MSSSDDEKLSQMIRDYIELDPSSPISSSKSLQVDQKSSFMYLQEILERVTVAESEILRKIFLYWKDLEPSKLRKWVVMNLGKDYYDASLCRTSWVTKFNRSSGEYEYIDVMMKNDATSDGAVRLIVDIDFRSQFELARPTPEYEELSNSLPSIFVGTELKLEKIISLVCSAAKESLRERGLHVPPWRKARYMHSKWLSENCKKISFPELGTI
ncbi:unnamed protein product [Coffea canephora]|uniref:Uncharacterized protein n=2 Tax=Coffea TaxID=13442 RepID=A0A068VCJ6_COFCA|nr:uncharacterized protein LOC113713684 [Coffea arabica]CDP18292.1 unnamed protein product [Coffea canephora]